jgi:transposase
VTVITVRSPAAQGDCPDCGSGVHRVHSRYARTLADLPLSGRAVQLKLLVRRFRCDRALCTLGPTHGTAG